MPNPIATKPFGFFCMNVRKQTPQLPPRPLYCKLPHSKSQLAAWEPSVEVRSVVIALPRQDWSKTSWLHWKAAMTTHGLNKQQEQLFAMIIIKIIIKINPTPAKLQHPFALTAAGASLVLASCRNWTTAACVLMSLFLSSDRATG